MTACSNCGWQPPRAAGLCIPCYVYQRRTGRPRPAELVLRHLARVLDDEAAGR